MNTIYICSTYYHVYITMVKTLLTKEQPDILLTHYIPKADQLLRRLISTKLFRNIYRHSIVYEYLPTNPFYALFFLHRRNFKLIRAQLQIDITNYHNIYIFHDDTWFAHYLKECKIEYRVLEDALDTLKIIKTTSFAYMIPVHNLSYYIKKLLNFRYFYFLDWKFIKSIEVNQKDDLAIGPSNKIIKSPRKTLIEKLSEEDRMVILKSFLNESDIPNLSATQKSMLLLTQPLYVDGLVETKFAQFRFFQRIVEEYLKRGYKAYIKPHPRDTLKYHDLDAVIMDKNMPIEVLNFLDKSVQFDIAICYNSTALNGITFVKEKINIYTGGSYDL